MTTIDRPQSTPPTTALGSVPPMRVAGLTDIGVTLGTPELVEIASLRVGESPRTGGEDVDHTALLMECDASLPPILVHRPTMEIVDGLHRVRAAQAKGQNTIEAVLLDGSRESAFVVAVAVNLGEGLPLSLADRRQAAARIVHSHPHWSDRSISRLVGPVGEDDPDDTRLLRRDPRRRQLERVAMAGSGPSTRRLAAGRPPNTLPPTRRARCGRSPSTPGISPNTVRDVRNRLRSRRGPRRVLEQDEAGHRSSSASPSRAPVRTSHVGVEPSMSVRPLVASLSRDPATPDVRVRSRAVALVAHSHGRGRRRNRADGRNTPSPAVSARRDRRPLRGELVGHREQGVTAHAGARPLDGRLTTECRPPLCKWSCNRCSRRYATPHRL